MCRSDKKLLLFWFIRSRHPLLCAAVIFQFGTLREKRSAPLTKQSGIACSKNSCITPVGNCWLSSLIVMWTWTTSLPWVLSIQNGDDNNTYLKGIGKKQRKTLKWKKWKEGRKETKQGWLPAATKAKLVRQVLVKGKRSNLSTSHLRRPGTQVSKPILISQCRQRFY